MKSKFLISWTYVYLCEMRTNYSTFFTLTENQNNEFDQDYR